MWILFSAKVRREIYFNMSNGNINLFYQRLICNLCKGENLLSIIKGRKKCYSFKYWIIFFIFRYQYFQRCQAVFFSLAVGSTSACLKTSQKRKDESCSDETIHTSVSFQWLVIQMRSSAELKNKQANLPLSLSPKSKKSSKCPQAGFCEGKPTLFCWVEV